VFDHIIMFRADDLSPEIEAELMTKLASLAEVPGILDFALGKNVSDRSRGFDYCMRITFADEAAHDAYQAHPHHLDIVRYNRTVTTEHICVDFAWKPSPALSSADGQGAQTGS
jgi:hypothetical protein